MEQFYTSILHPDTEKSLRDSRIILMTEEITDRVATVFIANLLAMDADSTKPIKIYLKTPGGDVEAGFDMIDAIMLCKSPVEACVIGSVCSMGLPILASIPGPKRCYKHARFMHHEISGWFDGKYSEIKARGRLMDALQKDIVKFLLDHTKMPADLVTGGIVDQWFNAETAMEYGLVTEIM